MSTTSVEEEVETKKPVEIFRNEYKPLDMIVSKINMDFNIMEGKTIVSSEMFVEKNPALDKPGSELVLDGDETSVKLLSIKMNDKLLKEGDDYILRTWKTYH